MSAPPHSVEPPPSGLREDHFASRNNFLYLLLGLIATAERLLLAMPGGVPPAAAPSGTETNPRSAADPHTPRTLLR